MSDFYSLPEKDESDAKAWFYLDHRADIETWASLRAEGVALLERYMLSLAPGMSELAAELNAEPYERDLEAGPWPLFGLTRPDWQFNGHQDIAIAVEWERRELLRGIQRPWPYVGVRVDPSHKDPERRAAVASAVARARPQFDGRGTGIWPVWAYIAPAPGEGAVDPAAIADQAWERLRQLWELVASALDELHR